MTENRLLIAERFLASCADLSEIVLPLDVIARDAAMRVRILVVAANGDHRVTTLTAAQLSPRESLRLRFAPFTSAANTAFLLGVFELSATPSATMADVQALTAAAAKRSPIALDCRNDTIAELLIDERSIAAFRVAPPSTSIRTAHWIDAFWCDAYGVFVRGWVHAYEHPVRALRIESAGRSITLDELSDRPDLLHHYPEHEHVRRGGFVAYLDCPPGHPVTLTLETDGGVARIALAPDGPIPEWPEEVEHDDEVTPILRRFSELVNARGGRLLQVGARTPEGMEASPPRHLLRSRVIGLDIHPGRNVDIVGDAHGLSRFLRERSIDGVLSASVIEHLEAPWIFAAEVNRVLAMGGLVYHQVPSAWPGHAQPNDFWRISAEGLRVLFGPATGFEILDASESGRAAIIPGRQWRRDFLEMPTVPAFTMAEVLARKVEEIEPGAVAWPLASAMSETNSRRYPVAGLRPSTPRGSRR